LQLNLENNCNAAITKSLRWRWLWCNKIKTNEVQYILSFSDVLARYCHSASRHVG